MLPTAQGPLLNRVTSPDNHTGFREWAGMDMEGGVVSGRDMDMEGGVIRRLNKGYHYNTNTAIIRW